MLLKKDVALILPTLLLSAFFICSFFSCPVLAAERIDINTATLAQLDQLDGIGEAYAQRIIDGRPYSSLDDLLRVKGIGPTTLQKIKDQGLACVNCGASQENSASQTLTPSDSPAPTSAAAPLATPTPGYQYSQKVFINEFLPWPEDDVKEWVELINLDTITINLSGWQIDDGNASTSPQAIPASTIIAPGEFLVISFSKSVLNNDGDKVRLLWPDDQVVHTVAFARATQNQAVAKFDTGWLWTNQPTPGQVNKKSLTKTIETVSSAGTQTNSVQIATVNDVVAAPAGAPARVAQSSANAPLPSTIVTPLTSPSAGAPSLAAAVSENVAAVKSNGYLSLVGVLFLAVLSAGGLIYFRRQKSLPDLDGE